MDNEYPDYPPLTPEEIVELKKIEATINRSRKLSPRIKKNINFNDKKRNYTAIAMGLEEYLDSYILIGFDSNGNDYVATKALTPLDIIGLNSLIQKVTGRSYDFDDDDDDFDDDDD
jgi:hypothetical protein